MGFCAVVICGVVAAIVAGLPADRVGPVGVWTVSAGAIAAVLYRFASRRR